MRGVRIPEKTKQNVAFEGGRLMVYEDLTLYEVAERVKCPMSSVYKWMMKYLPDLSAWLYQEVREVIEEHKKRGGRR